MGKASLRRRLRRCVVGVVFVGSVLGVSAAASEASPSASWTVYHGSSLGSGVATGFTANATTALVWRSSALDGDLYGSPLVFGDNVYVATENDSIYDLNATSGAVVWRRHVGTGVPTTAIPCLGDISPTVGITGTPVIDPARHELFAISNEVNDGVVNHWLVGVDTTTGAVLLHRTIDPAHASPLALLQRTGLTLSAGRVIWAMGGNSEDCGNYRGRVGSEAETGSPVDYFTVDAALGQLQGAVWMGGAAPVVDTNGNVWVSSGNGSVYNPLKPYDHSDAVLELTPTMKLEQFFAPTTWASDNSSDLDFSVAPALLNNGLVVQAGKSRWIYLLRASHLGGIGAPLAKLASACPTVIDGGVVVNGSDVILPCLTGPLAVRVSTSPYRMTTLWRAPFGGGPAVEAGGLVWTYAKTGVLYGLDPSSGQVVHQLALQVPANHFPTPAVGDGLLFVTSANRVNAVQ